MRLLICLMLFLSLISCRTVVSSISTSELITERDTVITAPLPQERVDTLIELDTMLTDSVPIVIETSVSKVVLKRMKGNKIQVELTNKDSIDVTSRKVEIVRTTEKVVIKNKTPCYVRYLVIILLTLVLVLGFIIKFMRGCR